MSSEKKRHNKDAEALIEESEESSSGSSDVFQANQEVLNDFIHHDSPFSFKSPIFYSVPTDHLKKKSRIKEAVQSKRKLFQDDEEENKEFEI